MTSERIEELYKSGAITFQEAMELSGKESILETQCPEINHTEKQEPVKQLTKEDMVNGFIEHLLEPVTIYEDGEYVTYDLLPLDEVLDHLERNQIMWRGEKPTIEKIEKEIKSLTNDAITRCLGYADEGYKKEECHCWVEGTCFRVDAYFDGDDKNISVDVMFVPEHGFTSFDYEKYKLLPGLAPTGKWKTEKK